MNNLSPKFTKTFDIVWHFEIRQDIEIYVYDWDSGDAKTCDVNKQVIDVLKRDHRVRTTEVHPCASSATFRR